jgi:hypothetical protein
MSEARGTRVEIVFIQEKIITKRECASIVENVCDATSLSK